jgi:glycosyltransferase involved in cell wall biosynthesis
MHVVDRIYQGSRTHCIEIFSRAVQLAQDIDFYFFLSDPARLFKANASFAATNATTVPISHGGAPARLLFELPALAKRWQLDLLHCQYIVPPFCPCATAVTIHDILFESNPEFFSKTFVLRSRLMVRRSARQSSLVFTGSEFSRQELIRRYKLRSEQVTCIYNGVDHSRFRVGEQPAQELEPYGLRRGGYLLTVGRLEPRKNHLRLLQAYVRLPQPRPKLVIIGQRDFGYSDVLETIRRDHLSGEVVLLENVDDAMLPVFYRNASLFVYPSLAEGFGLPLLEAMASGIPVVTSANTSLREVGGDAVLYIQPEDPGSIASGISAALADAELRKNLVDRGLRRATEYSWGDSADRMVSEYRGLRRRNRDAIAGGGRSCPVS